MQLNINSDASVRFTNTLEQMHRSALPNAIRNTLNNAVYDAKTITIPESATSNFTNRTKNFFKANSKFEKAKGFDVNTMQATVGFYNNNLKGKNNNAVKDLEQQEHGGTIERKSFIPLETARTGKSYGKNVKANLRLRSIGKIIKARNQRGKTKGEQFIQAILKAGAGGFVLGGEHKGQNLVWKVNSLSSKLKTKELDITPVYDYQKGRTVKVQKTEFMKEASLNSANKMDRWFPIEARKQIDRLRK